MASKKKNISPALHLVLHTWQHVQKESWLHLNTVMHDALVLAVKARMMFDKDDFNTLSKEVSAGRWMGSNAEEAIYGLAVQHRNMPACHAWEYFTDREPYILRGRLYVGREVEQELLFDDRLRGMFCKVTSMTPEDVVICAYDRETWLRTGGKRFQTPARRITLSLAEVKDLEKRNKAANKG
jgi:hypothetical protein